MKNNILIFFLLVVVFFIGFYWNFYNTIPQGSFEQFDVFSESLVIGRLNVSRNKSIIEASGFPGTVIPPVEYTKEYEGFNWIPYQFDLYEEVEVYEWQEFNPKDDYTYYYSQIGGQGIVFSILQLMGINSYKFFQFLTALMSSVVFASIACWLRCKKGFVEMSVFVLLILATSSITLFAKNLWWQLWVFYLPFVSISSLYIYSKFHNLSKRNFLILQIIISILTISIKIFLNGYEFISSTLIMSTLPVIFFGLLYKQKIRSIIKYFIFVSVSLIIGTLLMLGIHLIQLSLNKGSFDSGFEVITTAYSKRTNNSLGLDLSQTQLDSTNSSVSDILNTYLRLDVFDPNHTIFNFLPKISIGELLFICILMSIILLSIARVKYFEEYITGWERALVITFFISILSPLSWLILFKGHSYIHTHLNHIIFFMPTFLFGFMIIASGFRITMTLGLQFLKSKF